MKYFRVGIAKLVFTLPLLGHGQGQNFYYTTTDGTITITRYVGSGGAVIVPSQINGMPVIAIGDDAFAYVSSVTSVTIPNSVSSIGVFAFQECIRLATVSLPDGLTSIGGGAFQSCIKLTCMRIPSSVTNLGGGAFIGCSSLTAISVDALNALYSSLDGVLFDKGQTAILAYPPGKAGGYTIPDTVTSMPGAAFFGCSNLTSVTILNNLTNIAFRGFSGCLNLTNITFGANVKEIAGEAFEMCVSLAGITVPDGITRIAEGTFRECFSLARINIPNSVTNIGDVAFIGCTSLSSIAIPNTVTSIGWAAFEGCTSLASLAIPDGVTSIGRWAFAGCSSLNNVAIAADVTQIGERAFIYCPGLIDIAVDPRNSFYSSAAGVLFDKNQTMLIQYPTGKAGSYTMPPTVFTIGAGAFSESSKLVSITLATSLTNIGSYAFSSCTGLTNVLVPDGVITIEFNAFYGCTGLTTVAIGSKVATIDDSAFAGCSGLSTIAIPRSVTSLGLGVFEGCIKLTEFNVEAANSVYSSAMGVLFDKGQTTVIAYPIGKIGGYTIPEGVVNVGESAFSGCTNLTSVILSKTLTNIGTYGFSSCTGLTNLIIPKTVTTLQNFAFYSCTGLKGIYFEGDAPKLGALVFSGDYNATVYYLPGTSGWPSTFGGLPTALWTLPKDWVVSGAVTNGWIAIASSADGTTILAAAGTHSLWFSTNSGIIWISNNLPVNDWWSAAVSADGSKWFAVANNFSPGIYVSTNAGASWTRRVPAPEIVWSAVASSGDGTRVVAAAESFTSTNSGQLWASRAAIYTSTDAGINWTLRFQTAETISQYLFAIPIRAVASSADGSRLAAIQTGPDYTGFLFTSRDGGSTWVSNAVDAESSPSSDFSSLACSADGLTLVLGRYFNAPGIFVSRDGGSFWTRTNINKICSVACSADGLRLAAIDGYGVIYTSQDGGAGWKRSSLPYHTDWGTLTTSTDGSKLVAAVRDGGIYISQATPSPVLKPTISGDNFMLSWLVPSQTFLLQQNFNIATDKWEDVETTPTLDYTNLHYNVGLPLQSTANVFYRLVSR